MHCRLKEFGRQTFWSPFGEERENTVFSYGFRWSGRKCVGLCLVSRVLCASMLPRKRPAEAMYSLNTHKMRDIAGRDIPERQTEKSQPEPVINFSGRMGGKDPAPNFASCLACTMIWALRKNQRTQLRAILSQVHQQILLCSVESRLR